VTRRRRLLCRLFVLWLPFALIMPAWPGHAAAQDVLLVQDDLADLIAGDATARDWTTTPRADLQRQLCAERSGAPARLAIASQRLTRRQHDGCVAGKDGRQIETLIGRRALLAMTAGANFDLTPEILYRALARDTPGAGGKLVANRVARWRQLDASLPDTAIKVLLPPPNSIEQRIFSEIILYEGCAARSLARLPVDPVRRLAACTNLRTDSAVTRRADKQTVSMWLSKQPVGAIALVGVATLLAEPDLQTPLPLDGVTPSFATIADGRYSAVLPVYLLTVIAPATARTIAGIAGPMLAESSIGPLGKLPRRGLAPLSAADRVRLRATLGREFDRLAE
jgi:phosphate transport system substrate-binding protein